MMDQDAYIPESSVDPIYEILINAINNRASDVHFEPDRDTFNIRFRIDGILHVFQNVTQYTQDNIISRIKVLAKMDITDRRFPQDGHFEFKHQDIIYNIRVSTLPTAFGETIVFRILNRNDILISLNNLGFTQEQRSLVDKLITLPSGIILSTGPTGSGKTTLLYSMLNTLNKPENNIIALEDPIELTMQNVRQVQINDNIDYTFARAMRTVIRQDPDIIMVGEIRDNETAQMAIRASLIGILVLSTFHTFDLPGLVVRFIEMGVTRSTAAEAIKGVISARLVRKVCISCKADQPIGAYEKEILGVDYPNSNYQKGKGCNMCTNTGYLGRTGIFEIVYLDDEFRTIIIEKNPSDIYECLRRKHIKSLRETAIDKVAQGITTPEEIVRVMGLSPTNVRSV